MKCPKCGYNTFEYLDSCKKCGKELAAFKESLGIRPLVFQAAAPAAVSLDGGGELMQSSDAMPQPADDKLFQWDTPESAAGSGLPGAEEFGMVPGGDMEETAKPPTDPFSFDEEFEIPLSPQQSAADTETEDPFGGFSLDDSGSSQEGTLPDMILAQQVAQEKSEFEGFAFEDEKSPQAEEQAAGKPSTMVAVDSDDVFSGLDLEQTGGETGEKELFSGEEPASDSIFGEFSFDEQPASAVSPSPEPADLGLADIFDEKGGQGADAGLGGDFSLDAFADNFSGTPVESSEVGSVSSGEFDLDDFLKTDDEPKAAGAQGGSGKKSSDEDLDALFGELDLMGKK